MPPSSFVRAVLCYLAYFLICPCWKQVLSSQIQRHSQKFWYSAFSHRQFLWYSTINATPSWCLQWIVASAHYWLKQAASWFQNRLYFFQHAWLLQDGTPCRWIPTNHQVNVDAVSGTHARCYPTYPLIVPMMILIATPQPKWLPCPFCSKVP